MAESTRACQFAGCDRQVKYRYLCSAHYQQKHTRGEQLRPLRSRRLPHEARLCTFSGCARTHLGHDLCAAHLAQLRRKGKLTPIREVAGSWINGDGYRVVIVGKDHSEADRRGYAFEHRVVMSEILGRPLLPGENVHHISGDRLDNRPANLELWTRSQPLRAAGRGQAGLGQGVHRPV